MDDHNGKGVEVGTKYNTKNRDGYVRSMMGVVALVDCPREVGGHITVPGGARYLDTWAANHKGTKRRVSNYYPKGNNLTLLEQHKQCIPLQKGEMVIWDLRQFHGTFANQASLPRIGQFVRYIPAPKWFQKTDRFSPLSVYEQWPQLKVLTNKCLEELGSNPRERSFAGLK